MMKGWIKAPMIVSYLILLWILVTEKMMCKYDFPECNLAENSKAQSVRGLPCWYDSPDWWRYSLPSMGLDPTIFVHRSWAACA